MQKTLLVMRQEIIKMLQSTGYVIFAFVVPVAAVLALGVIKVVQARSVGVDDSEAVSESTEFRLEVEGFVDQSGLVRSIPAEFQGYLFAYDNEGGAKQAMASGKISAYYVIPADYLETGIVYYVYPDTKSYLADGQSWVMAKMLIANLLGSDMELVDWAWNPIQQYHEINLAETSPAKANAADNCARPSAACESYDLVRYLPSIMTALFFATFMFSSSMLLNSIGAEKENRTIEVLMTSISPRQLLTGKTLGLGAAGLLQTVIWLGAISFSFSLGGKTLSLPENFEFPLDILIWGIVFFLGGYGLYASIMAGAGALVPNMKEAGVANYIAVFPLFIGYLFGLFAPLTHTANSAFMIFLSVFPLTSPVVMIMRLTNDIIPAWQPIFSAILLFVSVFLSMRAAADIFHARNLLSGQPFSLRRYLAALVGGR